MTMFVQVNGTNRCVVYTRDDNNLSSNSNLGDIVQIYSSCEYCSNVPTPTPSVTSTPTNTPSATAGITPSVTATQTATPSQTATNGTTPPPTPTQTRTPTATNTPTPSITASPSALLICLSVMYPYWWRKRNDTTSYSNTTSIFHNCG
jgi:hypothetical protein